MQSFSHTISDQLGLHARPAGMLVKSAQGFKSKVVLHAGEKSADGKRIISVMQLGAKLGSCVRFEIEGEDEAAAAQGLQEFCANNL